MIKIHPDTIAELINLGTNRGIYLEGNILKAIDTGDDIEFETYINDALTKDEEKRKKRLEITKKVQIQNRELIASQEEKDGLMQDLQVALDDAETAKQDALNDLDLLQKKTQFELIGKIVQVALWIIIGVGVLTTILFIFAMLTGRDTTLLGNTWSNMFGILLTNSFSIIGTIMGVKYASEGSGKIDKQDLS